MDLKISHRTALLTIHWVHLYESSSHRGRTSPQRELRAVHGLQDAPVPQWQQRQLRQAVETRAAAKILNTAALEMTTAMSAVARVASRSTAHHM